MVQRLEEIIGHHGQIAFGHTHSPINGERADDVAIPEPLVERVNLAFVSGLVLSKTDSMEVRRNHAACASRRMVQVWRKFDNTYSIKAYGFEPSRCLLSPGIGS